MKIGITFLSNLNHAYCFWKLSLYKEANTFCFQMNKEKINNENKDMKGYSPEENDEIISKKLIDERNKK